MNYRTALSSGLTQKQQTRGRGWDMAAAAQTASTAAAAADAASHDV